MTLRAIQRAVLTGAVLLPLVHSSRFPEWDPLRAPLLTTLLFVSLVAALLRGWRSGCVELPRGGVVVGASIWLACSGISLVQCANVAEGTFYLAVRVAACGLLIATLLPENAGERHRLFPGMLAVSSALCLVGLLQKAGIHLLPWIGDIGPYPVATFGNGNYSGTFAPIGVAPAMAGMLFASSRRGRAICGAAVALHLVFVVATESRAGLLAMGGGLFVVILCGAYLSRERLRAAFVGIVVVFSLGIAACVFVLQMSGKAEYWLLRIASLADPTEGTNRIRVDLWSGAWQVAVRSPLGTGVGSFPAAYAPYRTDFEFDFHHRDKPLEQFHIVENAHGAPAQELAETGFPGMAAWIAMMALAFGGAWRWAARAPLEGAAALSAVAAYGIGSAFNSLDLMASHSAWFWLLLGLGCRETWVIRGKPAMAVAAGIAGVALLSLHALSVQVSFLRSRWIVHGAAANAEQRLADLETAAAIQPNDPLPHYELALVWQREGKRAKERGDPREAERCLKEARKRALAAEAALPNHAPSLLQAGLTYLNEDQPAEALRFFERVCRLAPRWAFGRFFRGVALYKLGRRPEAAEEFEGARTLRSDYAAAQFMAGLVQAELGRTDLARPPLEQARRLGYPVGRELKRRIPYLQHDPRLYDLFE